MTNTNPSIDIRREVLSNVLATYEKRVYDVAYRDALRPLLEADMPQLLETPCFYSEIDERLRQVGIFPTAFEHEDSRSIELRRLISATFHEVASSKPGWVFQDVHPHGLSARSGVKSGDDLLAINDNPVRPPLKPTVPANVVSQLAFQNGNGTKTLRIEPSDLVRGVRTLWPIGCFIATAWSTCMPRFCPAISVMFESRNFQVLSELIWRPNRKGVLSC